MAVSSKTLPKLNFRIALPLSILLTIYAIFAFTGAPDDAAADAGVFSSFRYPITGDLFLTTRLRTAPLWLYQGMHAGPAIFWCLAIPLQHVDSLRRDWKTFHRVNGYLTLLVSLVQTISGLLFLIEGHAYTHEDRWHLHFLKIRDTWVPPFVWPTFTAGLWLYSPVFLFTLVRTLQTARARQFEQHRKWAVLHSIAGYTIAIDRANTTTILIVGNVLVGLPESVKSRWLQLPTRLPDIAAAEISAFAGAAFFAYIIAGFWAGSQLSKAKQPPRADRL